MRTELRIVENRKEPGTAITDSQSVKTAETPELLLMVAIHTANIQGRDVAMQVLEKQCRGWRSRDSGFQVIL